jgi:hypothetical protein
MITHEIILKTGFKEDDWGDYSIPKSTYFLTKHSDLLDYNDGIKLYVDKITDKITIVWQPEYLFQGFIDTEEDFIRLLKQLAIIE